MDFVKPLKEVFAPQVSLKPSVQWCYEFMSDENPNHKERVSVVLAPITVKRSSDGSLLIGWACSKAKNCQNSSCRYARGNME